MRFVRFATLGHLFACAEQSIRHGLPEALVEALEARLRVLFKDLVRHEARRAAYKAEIEALGEHLKDAGEMPKLDEAVSGITPFNMARLVGQTGPLADFPSKRALLRYAGLNLRERTSGQYRGQTRLSKKGHPLLRKVLAQTVFPVLRRDRLYVNRPAISGRSGTQECAARDRSPAVACPAAAHLAAAAWLLSRALTS